MDSHEPLAASLDEASARLLSMRLRDLEARMDKFDGHKAVILSNMERLDIVEVELEGLKKRAAENSVPVGVLGNKQDGPATDGEGKAADKSGGIVSSRATGSEGSAGDPMPSFASMSTSGPVADSFGQLCEPPRSTLEVLEGLAKDAMTPERALQELVEETEKLGLYKLDDPPAPKKRGRPKGSRNKPKTTTATGAAAVNEAAGSGGASVADPVVASPCDGSSATGGFSAPAASPTTSPETEGVPW